jgi:hypothetical protein
VACHRRELRDRITSDSEPQLPREQFHTKEGDASHRWQIEGSDLRTGREDTKPSSFPPIDESMTGPALHLNAIELKSLANLVRDHRVESGNTCSCLSAQRLPQLLFDHTVMHAYRYPMSISISKSWQWEAIYVILQQDGDPEAYLFSRACLCWAQRRGVLNKVRLLHSGLPASRDGGGPRMPSTTTSDDIAL